MPFLGKGSVLEEILFNHFSTDVILQRDWVQISFTDPPN
jgi:hypothetical protein